MFTGSRLRAEKKDHKRILESFHSHSSAIAIELSFQPQALIEAKQSGSDPFAAIEAVMPWDTFAASVTEAQTLARPADFDFLHHIGESYATLRRYAPQFLGVLKLRAAPAAKGVLDAIDMLRGMNSDSARKVPADAPTAFIKD